MKILHLILFVTISLLCQSCISNKVTTIWINGSKSKDSMDDASCFEIYEGKELKDAEWKNYCGEVTNFTFEEGIVKRVKGKYKKDGNVQSFLVLEELVRLDRIPKNISGEWKLVEWNGKNHKDLRNMPSLRIDLKMKTVSGHGGCNNYSGKILDVTGTDITLGPLVSTKMACLDHNIEQQFFEVLSMKLKYVHLEDALTLKNDQKGVSLRFIKTPKQQLILDGTWVCMRIFEIGVPNGFMGQLNIDSPNKSLNGFDGCNDYAGEYRMGENRKFSIVNMASTNKYCLDMKTSNDYNRALRSATKYQINRDFLILLDKDNLEVLKFVKRKI